MEQAQEKIFELYLQRLSGTLSAEEEEYVQEMLQHDAGFKAQWDQLEQESMTLHTDRYLQQIDSDAALHRIKEEKNNTPPGHTPEKVAVRRRYCCWQAAVPSISLPAQRR